MNISAVQNYQQAYAVANTNANPYNGSPVVSDSPSPAFSTDFTSISSMVAHAGGGGFASYRLGAQMATDMKSIFGGGMKGVFGGIKNTAITGFKGAGLSALVSAGVSASQRLWCCHR